VDQVLDGGGGVARDSHGFRRAWCRLYRDITDPLCIEALAFRDVVLFASQQGFSWIVCKTDCQELVKLWRERQNQRSLIAPVFSEIEDFISLFDTFEFCFVGRSDNAVAHECARFACDHGVDTEWLDVCPEFLSHSLEADCTLNVVI
jgi:hypothetical protein